MKKIALLGCGNMTSAIFLPLKMTDLGFAVTTYTPSFTRAEDLAGVLGGKAVKDLADLEEVDYVFLGCKPQQFADLANSLNSNLKQKYKVISIMAGMTIAGIKEALPKCEGVVRVMPNTPALVGHGAFTTFFSEKDWQEKEAQSINSLFLGVGEVFEVMKEEDLDYITPINGSAPAYVFELARILEENMKKKGFSEQFATNLVRQTLVGSAVLLKNSEESAETLRNNVTSKGGLTEQALNVFNENDLPKIVDTALERARERGKELSNL